MHAHIKRNIENSIFYNSSCRHYSEQSQTQKKKKHAHAEPSGERLLSSFFLITVGNVPITSICVLSGGEKKYANVLSQRCNSSAVVTPMNYHFSFP